ncbi:hypothetical protein [[Eubacterium] hominis]|uniref:hypothetical protein n=1 Tax=[Eubacterium] hominis TaxID=2764325 RepID=UPI003A4E084D
MEENLEIASAIDERQLEKAYDNYCKKILSNKQILAYIMKSCISEYQSMELDEIVKYMEGTPGLEAKRNGNDKIVGLNVEDEKN